MGKIYKYDVLHWIPCLDADWESDWAGGCMGRLRCMQAQNLHLGLMLSSHGRMLLEGLYRLQLHLESWFQSPPGENPQGGQGRKLWLLGPNDVGKGVQCMHAWSTSLDEAVRARLELQGWFIHGHPLTSISLSIYIYIVTSFCKFL